MVATAGRASQLVQLDAGPFQLQRPSGRGGRRVGGGVHQDPSQVTDHITFAGPGQIHDVLADVVGAPLSGRLCGVALRDVVDDLRGPQVQGREQALGDAGGGQRGDEGDPGLVHRGGVGPGDEFGVADQEVPLGGDRLQTGHRVHDLADLGGAAVEGAVEDRDPAVGGDRQPGLDLLEIRAPVLGMPPGRRRILLFDLGERAVHRDRGHIPVQSGHVQAERADRRRGDRAGDAVQLWGDGVQRAGEPVVAQHGGGDGEDLVYRPLAGPVRDPQQRGRGWSAGWR